MIRISVFYDGESVKEFEQEESDKEITIGRASGCSIHLDESSISRLHAVVRFQNNSWVLERKANFGAVLLNGEEVENAPLEGGEEITIGKFSLRIDIDSATPNETKSMVSVQTSSELLDGKTKFVSAGVNALFRFEPGSANLSEFLMQKDIAIFGRGTNCDVVLTEKKASRKHCEIRRQGLSFFLKDLNSSNGTEINGKSIKEAELVPGDVVQIGESKFEFTIENKEYFSGQDQFMPVPAHLEASQTSIPSNDVPQNYIPGISPQDGGSPLGGSSITSSDEPQSLVGKARKRYLELNQRQRYIAIGVAFIFLSALMSALLGDPNEEGKKRVPKPNVVNGKVVRTIENLGPERQRAIKQTYKELVAAHEKRDYSKMQDLASKILTYVDDYKDTKNYEAQAKKGLEEIEDARRLKELKDKQDRIRAEVLALEEKGKIIFAKAMDDPRSRKELDATIQEIYSKDPNNQLALEWKTKIREKEEEEKKSAELAKQKEELKQKAETALAEVEKIFKAEKYIQALAEADKIGSIGYNEQEFISKLEETKNQIREKLNSVIGPLLKEAVAQRGEGGDLVVAKEKYLQVLKIDSTNQDALSGLDSIREILHARAKRFYSEAILAESVSDLTEAKEKYEKCLRSAPEEDMYKRRCKNKLSRFEALIPSGQ